MQQNNGGNKNRKENKAQYMSDALLCLLQCSWDLGYLQQLPKSDHPNVARRIVSRKSRGVHCGACGVTDCCSGHILFSYSNFKVIKENASGIF
jgi:hypothetical protein